MNLQEKKNNTKLINHWKLSFVERVWQGKFREIERGKLKRISRQEKGTKGNNKARKIWEWDDNNRSHKWWAIVDRIFKSVGCFGIFFPIIFFSLIFIGASKRECFQKANENCFS